MSLGRWDEAGEVIEGALELSPPPDIRAALYQLAGAVALARGDMASAAESAAASRAALTRLGYRHHNHLPLAELETELHLGKGRPGDALTTAEQALDRSNLLHSPRYAWPLVAAGAITRWPWRSSPPGWLATRTPRSWPGCGSRCCTA